MILETVISPDIVSQRYTKMNKEKEYFKTNQRLWDEKTRIHIKSDFYNLENFIKGESSLRKIELQELPPLEGKTLLHSQCHFGQDTLSLQRMGAHCTGIDLSEVAIAQAQELNTQLKLSAEFQACNVYDLDKHIGKLFDIVFTSYGVIGWLPDLDRWAHQLISRLKPGGVFYMAEFHPTMYMFDWDNFKVSYTYFNSGTPSYEEEQGTYADRASDIKLGEYFWQHSLEDIFMALIKYGLRIDSFREYDYSPYQIFGKEEKRADQEYLFRMNDIPLPLVFSIKGTKV